ncbi:MAG: hypothetical protein ACRDRU_26710 [Pseudonocardiaceae bacterium]
MRQAASPAGQQSRELYDQQIGDGVPYRQLTGEFVGVSNKAERGRRVIGQAALSQDELDKLHASARRQRPHGVLRRGQSQFRARPDGRTDRIGGSRPRQARRAPTRAPWRWVSGVVNRTDLEITEIPAKALVSDKLVLTFQVDYDAHGLNLTIDGPTGLMTAS